MDKRIRSNSVLTLGKKIVDELELDQRVDTLSRWMAHYIAEKMDDAESATGAARDRTMSECGDIILKLWAHRSELPNGKRPLESFEPVFRVLTSLDLDDTTSRYFRQVRSAADENDEDESTARWLDMASKLDFAARILIRYCLTMAAGDAVDRSREWVALAEAIREEDTTDIDIKVINFIADDIDTMTSEIPEDPTAEKIEKLLKRLETFIASSSMLSSHFRQQLEGATP